MKEEMTTIDIELDETECKLLEKYCRHTGFSEEEALLTAIEIGLDAYENKKIILDPIDPDVL